jgi:peptidoglycan hydrolase-like protein with peptidoglycan-binding domain
MRKSFLSVLVLVVLVLSTGCSEEKKEILPTAEKVIYDLAQYMFPDKNQTNNYMDNVFVDDSGKGVYAGDADTVYYPKKYEGSDTDVKAFNSNNTINAEYVIGNEYITRTSSMDMNYTILREAAAGETIITATEKSGEVGDPIYTEETISCILHSYLSEKEVLSKIYKDVLVVNCDVVEKKIISSDEDKITKNSVLKVTSFYAKTTGLI